MIDALRRCRMWMALPTIVIAAILSSPAGAQVTTIVQSATSHDPIAGAIISQGAYEVRTEADGRFTLPSHVGCNHAPVNIRAPGYWRTSVRFDCERTDFPLVQLQPLRPKAVYLSVYGIASQILREDVLRLQHQTAINALVIDVKGDRGLTPYPSAARRNVGAEAHAPTAPPRVPDLPALLKELHRRGLYLIARIVVFKDDPLATAHPEWAVRNAKGAPWRERETLQWIDPTIRAAWSHQLDLAEEAAQLGFDEIQFDYLRFPDAFGLRFSQANTEVNRVRAITDFLTEARARLRHYNVFLSVDIFGYVCWNQDDTAIGHRIEMLVPTVDYIAPMLYPSGFTWGLPGCERPTEHPSEIVRRSLAEAKRRTGLPGVRFRPWLQAFRDYAFDRREFDANAIREQVDAADAAETDGWMLWNPRNRYDPATLPHPLPEHP